MSASEAADMPAANQGSAVNSQSREIVPYSPPGPIPMGVRFQSMLGSLWFRSAFVFVAAGAGLFTGMAATRQSPERLAIADAQSQDIVSLKATIANLAADLERMRTSIDATTASVEQSQRNVASSLIQVSGAMDRAAAEHAVERTTLVERIDRLEKQTSSMAPTAAIAPSPAVPKAQLPQPAMATVVDKESSVVPMTPPAAQKSQVPIKGYVLRSVYDGMALVETRFGLREIMPGQTLPGAGRVQSIEKRGRKWVVITTAGLIDEEPYR